MIDNFQKRQKAEEIYNTFFDPESKTLIDFNLFNTLNFYGVIKEEEVYRLINIFETIGDKLYKQIKNFDENEYNRKNYK